MPAYPALLFSLIYYKNIKNKVRSVDKLRQKFYYLYNGGTLKQRHCYFINNSVLGIKASILTLGLPKTDYTLAEMEGYYRRNIRG